MGALACVLDLLLPSRCPGCRAASATPLCGSCRRAAEELRLPDLGFEELDDGVAAVGAFVYEGVIAEAIRTVKVGGQHAAAVGLSTLLWQSIMAPVDAAGAGGSRGVQAPRQDGGSRGVQAPRQARRQGWPVTWVPSTARRRRQRGAEIPRLLAGPGAQRLLRQVADRPDQTLLDPDARRRNPVGAFVARSPAPRRVVVVDDVRTTGATALAAADALRTAGARRVLVVTLAVAGWRTADR